jgi:general stress protein YciG
MGGEERRRELGPEGYAELGHRGGERTAETHGRDFYEKIGRMGGEERRRELGPEGYAELGRRGGRARWNEDEESYDDSDY